MRKRHSSWSMLACWLLLATAASAEPSEISARPPGPNWERKVGQATRQALADDGPQRVLVFLEVDLSRWPDRRQALPAIRAVRERVWNRLNADRAPRTLLRAFGAVPAFAATLDEADVIRLAAMDEVVRVDLDVGGSGQLAQANPLTGNDLVRALGLTGQGVTVAVLDSGIDTNHPDLSDDLVDEACFCSGGGGCCPGGLSSRSGPGAAEDDHGHGSNVTGIVTSGGTVAPTGSAPDADLVAVKVLDSANSFCCTSDVVAGLDWVLLNRPDVDVVNMSLGTFATFNGNCDGETSFTMALASAVNALRGAGVLSTVSSGNTCESDEMQAPACVANSVAVAAVWDSNVGPQTLPFFSCCAEGSTAADQLTCFSNRSSNLDLLAPGAPLTSASNFGGTSTFFGTSQAAPQVAGCAALLLEAFPQTAPDALEAALETSSVLVNDPSTAANYPRLDCRQALDVLACRDEDADGFVLSDLCSTAEEADCNDGEQTVFPGAAEGCDFVDTDCDGFLGPAEVEPAPVGQLIVQGTNALWTPVSNAVSYDLVVGDLVALSASGDLSGSVLACAVDDLGATAATVPDPAPGSGRWYLARATAGCGVAGSWGGDGAGLVGDRDTALASSGSSCN